MPKELDAIYEGLASDSAFVPESIKRRLAGGPVYADPNANVVNSKNWFQKTANSVIQRQAGTYDMLAGVGNLVTGDNESAAVRLQRWQENEDLARSKGPDVQDFGQIEDASGALSAVGYNIANMVPDMIGGLGAGLVAKSAVKGFAKNAAKTAITRQLMEKPAVIAAENTARRTAANAVVGDAAKYNAAEAATGAFDKQIAARAAKIAARSKGVQIAGDVGFAVGATTGSLPGQLREQGDFMAANTDMSQEDALKLLGGSTLAASTDFIPMAGLLSRFSKQGIKQSVAADRFAKRFAKVIGKQFAAEGTQEASQAFITRGSQHFVDQNIEMFSNEALADYSMNFLAGGVIGGTLAGSMEIGATGARKLGDGLLKAAETFERRRNEIKMPKFGGDRTPVDGVGLSGDPIDSVAAASATAVQSGRTLNSQAVDAGQIKASSVNEGISFRKEFEASRQSLGDMAQAYNDTQQNEFEVDDVVRTLSKDSFAVHAAAFILKGVPRFVPGGQTGDILNPLFETLKAPIEALGRVARYGIDSDLISDEDISMIDELRNEISQPERIHQLIIARGGQPTINAADEQLFGQFVGELNAADTVSDAVAGVPEATNDLGTSPNIDIDLNDPSNEGYDYRPGATVQTANQGLLASSKSAAANGVARVIQTLAPAELLNHPDAMPFLGGAVTDPAVVKASGGAKQAADNLAHLSLMQANNVTQPSTRSIQKAMARPGMTELYAYVVNNMTKPADAAAAADLAKSAKIMFNKNESAPGPFNERVANKKGAKSLYAVTRNGKSAVDIGSMLGLTRRKEDTQTTKDDESNPARLRREISETIAVILSMPELNVDAKDIPWGKSFMFGGAEIRVPNKRTALKATPENKKRRERILNALMQEKGAELKYTRKGNNDPLDRAEPEMGDDPFGVDGAFNDKVINPNSADVAVEKEQPQDISIAEDAGNTVDRTLSMQAGRLEKSIQSGKVNTKEVLEFVSDVYEAVFGAEAMKRLKKLTTPAELRAALGKIVDGAFDSVSTSGPTINQSIAVKAQKMRTAINRDAVYEPVLEQLYAIGYPTATTIKLSKKRDGYDIFSFGEYLGSVPGPELRKLGPNLHGEGLAGEHTNKDGNFYLANKIWSNRDSDAFVEQTMIDKLGDDMSPAREAAAVANIKDMDGDALDAEFNAIIEGKYSTTSRIREQPSAQFKRAYDKGYTPKPLKLRKEVKAEIDAELAAREIATPYAPDAPLTAKQQAAKKAANAAKNEIDENDSATNIDAALAAMDAAVETSGVASVKRVQSILSRIVNDATMRKLVFDEDVPATTTFGPVTSASRDKLTQRVNTSLGIPTPSTEADAALVEAIVNAAVVSLTTAQKGMRGTNAKQADAPRAPRATFVKTETIRNVPQDKAPRTATIGASAGLDRSKTAVAADINKSAPKLPPATRTLGNKRKRQVAQRADVAINRKAEQLKAKLKVSEYAGFEAIDVALTASKETLDAALAKADADWRDAQYAATRVPKLTIAEVDAMRYRIDAVREKAKQSAVTAANERVRDVTLDSEGNIKPEYKAYVAASQNKTSKTESDISELPQENATIAQAVANRLRSLDAKMLKRSTLREARKLVADEAARRSKMSAAEIKKLKPALTVEQWVGAINNEFKQPGSLKLDETAFRSTLVKRTSAEPTAPVDIIKTKAPLGTKNNPDYNQPDGFEDSDIADKRDAQRKEYDSAPIKNSVDQTAKPVKTEAEAAASFEIDKARLIGQYSSYFGKRTIQTLVDAGVIQFVTAAEHQAKFKGTTPTAAAVKATIYIITDRADATTKERVATLLHEAVHAFLPRTMSKAGWHNLNKAMFTMTLEHVRSVLVTKDQSATWLFDAFDSMFAATGAKGKSAQSMDELLAYAQDSIPLESRTALKNLIERVMARIKTAMAKHGVIRNEWLNDPEFVRMLAVESLRDVAKAVQSGKTRSDLDAENYAITKDDVFITGPQLMDAVSNGVSVEKIADILFEKSAKAVGIKNARKRPDKNTLRADVDKAARAKRVAERRERFKKERAAKKAAAPAAPAAKLPAVNKVSSPIAQMSFKDFAEFANKHLTPTQRVALYDMAHGTFADYFRKKPDVYNAMLGNDQPYNNTIYALMQAYANGDLALDNDSLSAMRAETLDKIKKNWGFANSDDLAIQVLKDMASGDMQKTLDAGKPYQPEIAVEQGLNKTVIGQGIKAVVRLKNATFKILSDLLANDFSQAYSSGIPAWVDLANAIETRSGHRLSEGVDGVANRGVGPKLAHENSRWLRRMQTAIGDLDAVSQTKVLKEMYYNLKDPRPGVLNNAEIAAFRRMRKMYRDIGEYGVDAKVIENLKDNYTPILFDTAGNVAQHKANLVRMLSQLTPKNKHKYEALLDELYVKANPVKEKGQVQRHFTSAKEAEQAAFIIAAVNNAFYDTNDLLLDNQMGSDFKFASPRVFQQIFDMAKATGDNTDLDTLVSTLEPSIEEHGVRYIEPLVAKSEEAKAFPKRFTPYETAMRAQGATPDQIMAAKRLYNATFSRFEFDIIGPDGEKGSPTVARFLGKSVAGKIHNRKFLTTTQNIGAIQNMRLLPLALLSSLVDPGGILVRAGGDMNIGLSAFKTAAQAMFNPELRAQLQDFAEAAGYAADMHAAQSLHQGYGADARTPFARKWNSLVFKFNGMEALTKYTRLVAIQAAHSFLAKHQDGARSGDAAARKLAERYFAELGIKVDDVRVGFVTDGPLAGKQTVLLLSPEQMKTANKNQLEADARIKAAIIQFTDEAILRPSNSQTPGWHKDPFVKLITQYKAFSYAIFEQITRRLGTEFQNGNYSALINAALVYLPVMLMAEMMREFIQWGPEGNPQRKNWSIIDYGNQAAGKTGLAGPQAEFFGGLINDASRDNILGQSFAGPTAASAVQAAKVISGNAQPTKFAVDHAPGAAIYRRWGGNGRGEPEAPRANASPVIQ